MISPEKKKKLRDFLGNDLIEANEKRDIKEVKESVDKTNETLSKSMTDGLRQLEKKISKIQNTDLTPVIDALNKFADTIIKTHKPQDLSGFFKDFAMQIAETGKTSEDTRELIRNLKWNSTMGIKNRSGSPISPAISSFAISDYDDIRLSGYDGNNNPSTVTYLQGGGTIAVLALTYDGSGNLTEARRTS